MLGKLLFLPVSQGDRKPVEKVSAAGLDDFLDTYFSATTNRVEIFMQPFYNRHEVDPDCKAMVKVPILFDYSIFSAEDTHKWDDNDPKGFIYHQTAGFEVAQPGEPLNYGGIEEVGLDHAEYCTKKWVEYCSSEGLEPDVNKFIAELKAKFFPTTLHVFPENVKDLPSSADLKILSM